MIVRDQGDSWQLVAQPDHGDVCGAIAAAWGNERFAASPAHASVATAARRHDDGWAVWERTPDVDRLDGDGRPLNVFDIGLDIHLAFFSAMIAAVRDEDAYAGVLASMHAAGLYTQRYGTDPSLKMTQEDTDRAAVDAFVAERDRAHEAQARDLGISESQRWKDYKLLQVADRLCLFLCLNDLVGGSEGTLTAVPTADGGEDVEVRVRSTGPWEVALDPYPFTAPVVELILPRRVLPKRRWTSREDFAAAYRSADVERRAIALVDGGAA